MCELNSLFNPLYNGPVPYRCEGAKRRNIWHSELKQASTDWSFHKTRWKTNKKNSLKQCCLDECQKNSERVECYEKVTTTWWQGSQIMSHLRPTPRSIDKRVLRSTRKRFITQFYYQSRTQAQLSQLEPTRTGTIRSSVKRAIHSRAGSEISGKGLVF